MRYKRREELVPAIVLGCHKIGLGIIRALGAKKVPIVGVYYNKMDMGYVSRFVISSYQCPHPDHDEKSFVNFLDYLASKWEGSVLIPSDDATLIPVSKYKDLLEGSFKVSANNWDVSEKCIIKKYTYSIAERIGIPSPRTLIPNELKEAEHFASKIGFPCLLKPSISHSFFEIFRRKMITVQNVKEVEDIYKKAEEAGLEIMIQEFIPGDDTFCANYNSFYIEGKPRIEVTAEKVRLSPPQTGFPRVVVSKDIPLLLDLGRRMLSAINYDGFSCMEFKKDSKNETYKLMEINGRLNLSAPLSVKCGINFPFFAYLYALNGKIPDIKNKYKEGIYWIDTGRDIVESIRSIRKEKFSIIEYIRPYLHSHISAVFSIKDPKPFLKRTYEIIKLIHKFVLDKLRKFFNYNKFNSNYINFF